jgi:hypothetical protein
MVESIISQIKKCVTFIFVKNENGQYVPNGTGFFVGVKTKQDPNLSYNYLVTAKHVLQDKNGNFYSSIGIRSNTHDGSSKLSEISMSEVIILTHSDKDVDIALFHCTPNVEVFDYLSIPEEIITTKNSIKTLEIEEGDEVFFAGLFTSHIGQKRNQPILRFGKVALMSDEKIEWKVDDNPSKFLDLYLLECQSFGGNSGSPVFFYLNSLRKPEKLQIGSPEIYLAGVMTGSFLNPNPVASIETKESFYSLQNVGIAAVTPCYKLHEILFSEIAEKIRSGQI